MYISYRPMSYTESVFKNYKCIDESSNNSNDSISGGGHMKSIDDNNLNRSVGFPISQIIKNTGSGTNITSRFDNLVVPAGLVLENSSTHVGKIYNGGGTKKLAIFESNEYNIEPISTSRFDNLISAVSISRKKSTGKKTKSNRSNTPYVKKTRKIPNNY